MISQLNKAAKCKASLQEFATSHDVVFTANMTMDQIYGRVEQKLTLMVPPTTTDKVNFGEYANLEYGQLLEDHPQYASWVQKTAKEGDCNWRLARLASWLNEGPPAPRHQKKLVTKGGKGRGKSSQQQADDSSNASWGKVSQASSSELSALKEELDRLRSENAELTLQMERNKSRKEMWNALAESDTADDHVCFSQCPQTQCSDNHKRLGYAWQEHNNPFGACWQDLVHSQRLFLLEIACSEHSVLSAEVHRQMGTNAAQRCSIWNGYDLTAETGVRKLKKLISATRPVHIWVSCDCGPFSPLQRLNTSKPGQQQALDQKRQVRLCSVSRGHRSCQVCSPTWY